MTNEIKYIDFDSICRLCLEKYNGDQEFIPIFLHHNYGERHGKKFKETIIDIINSFTSLLVDPSDGLPIHICFHCSEKLCDTHTFKQKCIESIQLLNEIKARHLDNKLTFESDDYDSEDNAPLNRFKRPELIIVDVVKQIPNLNNELIGVGDLNLKITENNNIQVHQHQENLENNKHLSSDCSASIIYRSGNDEQFQTSAQLLDSIPKLQPFQPQSSSTSTQPKKSRKKPRCNLLKQCNFCGVIVKSLRDHMRTHPGQLPYKCNLCKRPYITKLGLNRHMDIQHGIHSELKRTIPPPPTIDHITTKSYDVGGKQQQQEQQHHQQNEQTKFIRNQRKLSRVLTNYGAEHVCIRNKRIMPAKYIREPCGLKCRIKCIFKITNQHREKLFKEFWQLGNIHSHWEYIRKSIEEIHPKYRRPVKGSNRSLNLAYYFKIDNERVRVCQTFFCTTLGIGDGVVRTAQRKCNENGELIENDKRGGGGGGARSSVKTHGNSLHLFI